MCTMPCRFGKTNSFVSRILKGGKLVEYGAKTLPEGGYYSIPKVYVDNALIVGDSAGLVTMPALKGVHLAIKSGMLAAQTTADALSKNDTSENSLRQYENLIKNSFHPSGNVPRSGISGKRLQKE